MWRIGKQLLRLGMIVFSCAALPCVFADTFNWNNTGTDFDAAASWTNANILGPSRAPTFTDTANFDLPELTNPVITASSAIAIAGLQFDTLGTGYTLSTQNQNVFLAIGTSGIAGNNALGTNTITSPILLNMDESVTQAANGTLNVTGPLRMGGGSGTTHLTIGSTSGSGTINFSPSSAEIGNDINLTTNVNVTLPAVVSETAGAGIIKTGSATLTMTGASTYDGPTLVNAGTLLASNGNIGSATGSAAVNVNSGALLGGTGRITGLTTINAEGTITGANAGTIGTLKLDSDLSFAGVAGNKATLLVDVSGASADKITVGGALDLSGASDRLLFSGSADGTTSYVLATYASHSGLFDTVTNLPSDYTLLYKTNELDLVPLTAVPEPAGWFAATCVVGLLLVRDVRRRSGK
jgi:autotransporter-associated beta strand protein